MFNGILSIVIALVAAYMIFTSNTDMKFVLGFLMLIISMLFLCFSLLEERKEEIERLRQVIIKLQGLDK